jgi:hypothetical protein
MQHDANENLALLIMLTWHYQNGITVANHWGCYINHRISSPYHPQSSDQVELSNRKIKLILQKKLLIGPKRIGLRNWMMHFGPTEHHIKILWVCLPIKWFMEKLVIGL